ncbi:MAG: LysR substrate-binding domain-containing protein [Actinomycetota bacterium]
MNRIELRQLRYFIAVAEELHFGHAADRLRIAQPGLSQQIKVLERSVGVELLTRDKRTVRLTEAGRDLLQRARLIVELADRAVESAGLAARGRKGPLKVGTRSPGNPQVADELLRSFEQRFPDVEVEIHPGLVPQNIDAIARRKLDVAIVVVPFATPDDAGDLNYLRLGEQEPVVALSQRHRLAALDRIPRSELLRETFLDWPRSANPVLIDHLHRVLFGEAGHPQSRVVPEIAQGNRVLMVAESQDFTVTADPWDTDLGVQGVVFRRLEDPVPLIEYGIAWLDSPASPFLPQFLQLARELADGSVIGGSRGDAHHGRSRAS